MTDEEDLRRLLNDAAAEIPAGNAPVAELVREGRRARNRRHIVQGASVAASVAVVAVGAFIVGPSIGGSGNLTTQPTTSPTTEADLLGQWRAVGELGQELESAGFPDESKVLEFSQHDGGFWWAGNDECSRLGGRFEVSSAGAFSAFHSDSTQIVCSQSRPRVVTVPDVMDEATGVRLVAGQLRLFDETDSLLATFERLEAAPTTPPRNNNQDEPGEGTPILLSTSSWKPGDGAMRAIVGGYIALSKDGCVYLKQSGAKQDVMWPAGYSADVSADGVLTVRNPAGEPVGYEGTKISADGGDLSKDEGGIPDGLLRLLECHVSDSVVIIQDVLPPLSAPTTSPSENMPPLTGKVVGDALGLEPRKTNDDDIYCSAFAEYEDGVGFCIESVTDDMALRLEIGRQIAGTSRNAELEAFLAVAIELQRLEAQGGGIRETGEYRAVLANYHDLWREFKEPAL